MFLIMKTSCSFISINNSRGVWGESRRIELINGKVKGERNEAVISCEICLCVMPLSFRTVQQREMLYISCSPQVCTAF